MKGGHAWEGRAVTSFFLLLSMLGFVASMAMHFASVSLGLTVGGETIEAMLMGCFVVAIPAFFFHPDSEPGNRGALPWRSLLHWPRWLQLIMGALMLYVVWFCLSRDLAARWQISSEMEPRYVQGSCLVCAWLYAVCSALLYDKRQHEMKGSRR